MLNLDLIRIGEIFRYDGKKAEVIEKKIGEIVVRWEDGTHGSFKEDLVVEYVGPGPRQTKP